MNKALECAALTSVVSLASLAAMAMPSSYEYADCLRALDCRRLDSVELDHMRGGFSFMSGSSELELRIGISRAVFINDQLVAVTQDLVLPTLQQLRDGTYVPSATMLGTVSASSQPAQTRPAPQSAAVGDGSGAPVSAGGTQPGGTSAAPLAAGTPPAPGGTVAAAGSASRAAAVGEPSSVQVNGAPVNPGTPAVVNADELRTLVIQNGPGNVVTPSAADIRASAMATVLQNSLDSQTIRTMTTLTATTNALSAFREAAIREAIGQATTDLLR